MRAFMRPWAAVAIAVALLAACSDDGDDSSSTTTAAEATTSSAAEETTTTTDATTTTAAGDGSLDDEAVAQRLREVLDDLPGGQELEPAEEDCLLQEVIADGELSRAMLDGQDFEDLSRDLQGRAVLLTVDCAPRSIASAMVDAIGLDVDEAARSCLEDGFANNPMLLRSIAQVGLTAEGEVPPDEIPTDLILELLGLVEECGVPLSALS